MAKNTVYQALEAKEFETIGQVCLGTWEGYAVSLRPYGKLYFVDIAVRMENNKKQIKSITKSVKEHNANRKLNCIFNEKQKFISFQIGFDKKRPLEEQLFGYMSAILSALRENGVRPADTCAVCGGFHPDSICLLNCCQPVHSACVRTMADKARDEAQSNQENGSYLTGFIGALLGMLVGLIPSLLTIALMDRIYALLFALIPLASSWGYRKFNGKQNKASIFIVVLLSLLGVFVMQYLSVCIYLMMEYSVSFGEAFAFTMEEFMNLEGFLLVAQDSLVPVLFMLFGVFIAWNYVKKTNAGSIRQMDTVQSTLRPNPSAASQDIYSTQG